jgi:glycogen synthase
MAMHYITLIKDTGPWLAAGGFGANSYKIRKQLNKHRRDVQAVLNYFIEISKRLEAKASVPADTEGLNR